MPLYYTLSENCLLQRWTQNVFALYFKNERKQYLLSEEVYIVIEMCDGSIDFSTVILPDRYRIIAEELFLQGIVNKTDKAVENYINKSLVYNTPYVAQAQWSVTGRCNYRCKHCYMSAPTGKYGELSFEECTVILNQLKNCGIMSLALTGGEPLVRKDFLELVKLICNMNIGIADIYTNGSLVNEDFLIFLKRLNTYPRFLISFDGKNHHNWLRGISDAEQKAVNAFKLLKKHGFPAYAEMCIYKGNETTIRETVLYLSELGVQGIKIVPATACGLWAEHPEKTLSPVETYQIFLEYIPHFFEDDSPMDIMLGGFFRAKKFGKTYSISCIKFNGDEDCKQVPLCLSARKNMYIAADGKVLPCISLTGMKVQDNFPNLKENSLSDILNDSNYLKAVSSTVGELMNKNKKCSKCKYRYWCGGGCRAGALIENENDYLGADEATCFLFKQDYPFKIKNLLDKLDGITSENEDFFRNFDC